MQGQDVITAARTSTAAPQWVGAVGARPAVGGQSWEVSDQLPEDDPHRGIDLVWFLGKLKFEQQQIVAHKENFKDFYKKYDNLPEDNPVEDLGPCLPAWCLVFELSQAMDDEEGEYSKVAGECLDTCQRLWAADLCLGYEISTSGAEIFITVSASYEVLVDEANIMKPKMRLKHCKGAAPFHSEYIPHYVPCMLHPAPEKQTCINSALRQRLVMHRMKRIAGYDPDEIQHFLSKDDARKLIRTKVSHKSNIRSAELKELLVTHGAYRPNAESIMGAEVYTLARQVLADKYFTCMHEHKFNKREQAMLHAQEEHMKLYDLELVKYAEIESVLKLLEDWVETEPGLSEKYVGQMTEYFPTHTLHELEYFASDWASYALITQPYLRGKRYESESSLTYFEESMETMHLSAFYAPVDAIRDYFGDHVGLYVAWLNLYTRYLVFPAAGGVLVTFFSLGYNINTNPLIAPYSIFLCFWTALFNIAWTRRESELAFFWGSENFEVVAPVRRQFKGIELRNDKTGRETIEFMSPADRWSRWTLSWSISLVAIVVVAFMAFSASVVGYRGNRLVCIKEAREEFGADWATNYPSVWPECQRCDVNEPVNDTFVNVTTLAVGHVSFDELDNSPGQCKAAGYYWNDGFAYGTSLLVKFRWKITGSFLNLALINIFGFIYAKMTGPLNDLENHRTQIEYDDQNILKMFIFQFVNNYFMLFYIGYLRQVPIAWTGYDIDTECLGGSCLTELRLQVGLVFTTKMIAGQLVEIFKPKLKEKYKVCCSELEQTHAATLVDKIMDSDSDGSDTSDSEEDEDEIRKADRQAKKEKRAKRRARRILRKEAASESVMEAMSYADPYHNTFDDFCEMAIQFGYLALFSPIYPMAPIFALLNNIVEMRVDAVGLCFRNRRPRWKQAENIGSWFAVFQALGFLAVITNATMVTMVGKQYAQTDEEDWGGMTARMENWTLWVRALGFEHGMLFLRVLTLIAIPSSPRWLGVARDELEHHLVQMKPAVEVLAEAKLHQRYLKKLDAQDDMDSLVDPSPYNCDAADLVLHGAVEDNLATVNNIRHHIENRKQGKAGNKAPPETKLQKKMEKSANFGEVPDETEGTSDLKFVNPLESLDVLNPLDGDDA